MFLILPINVIVDTDVLRMCSIRQQRYGRKKIAFAAALGTFKSSPTTETNTASLQYIFSFSDDSAQVPLVLLPPQMMLDVPHSWNPDEHYSIYADLPPSLLQWWRLGRHNNKRSWLVQVVSS